MSPCTVVFLLTYLDSQTGGMERQALQLATRLRANGHDVFFVTCAQAATMRARGLRWRDIFYEFRVFRIPLPFRCGPINAVLYIIGALAILVATRRRYAVIHAHQLWTSGIVACCVRMMIPGVRIVIKNCSGGRIGDVRQLKRFPYAAALFWCIARLADQCIAVSVETLEEMRAVGLTRAMLIPNGVDTEHFVPPHAAARASVRARLGVGPTQSLVLFVGRLVPKKNIHRIIDACRDLSRDVVVRIVGDGPLRADLERHVRATGMDARVSFLGTHDDVRHFYQGADVFVLPSENEGLPNALLEAMACGVPCVGTDIPSIAAVLRDRMDGVLVPVHDTPALAAAIAGIARDPAQARRYAQHARSRVVEQYDFSRTVAHVERCYAAVLHAPRCQ